MPPLFSSILPNFVGHLVVSPRFRLKLLHTIGCGAYGVVYLAHDLSTPDDAPSFYAVKCLLRHQAGSPLQFTQEREISYHKHMSFHPHVAKLHEVILDSHYVYIVMDYCDGGDLFGAIVDRKSFHRRDESVKRNFVQLLDAVEACHSEGIFHRDLKPENIMCSHDDTQIFLSDFGLATQTPTSNSFGCGSVYYMSPECIGETNARTIPYSTSASDVWSLGVILANMLTGRNPWRSASVTRDEGYAQYVQDGPRALLSILPISLEAARILARVFDPNPRTRITLPALRRLVLTSETFFPPEDASDYLSQADEFFAASLAQDKADDAEELVEVRFESVDLTESLVPCVSTPHMEVTHSFFVNGTSSTTESEESEGPETPEIQATQPITVIPHFALAPGNGVVEAMVQVPEPAKVHIRLPRTVQRFVGVIHRIL